MVVWRDVWAPVDGPTPGGPGVLAKPQNVLLVEHAPKQAMITNCHEHIIHDGIHKFPQLIV